MFLGGIKLKLDYRAIGVRIRRYRKEQGLTQQRLAELSELEPSNISHIERGATKLSLPTLVSIANSLGVTVDTLLCDNLMSSTDVYLRELDTMLSDCSHRELKIITTMVRVLKETLRNDAP